jgi:glycine oxidase
MSNREVLILGAGIAGLTVARELALRGWKPLVLERDRAGSHASSAAAGILVSRAVVRSQVPGRMFYTRSLEAYPRWVEELSRESGLPVRLEEGDDWCLFPQGSRAERFRERLERESDPERWEETDTLPPGLDRAARRRDWRVFHFPGERWIRPRELMASLVVAARKAGARIMEGTGPLRLFRDGEGWAIEVAGTRLRAGFAVVAAGPWSGEVLAELGWKADLVPVRGQLARVPALHGLSAMVHLEDVFYAIPRDGFSVVGATAEHGVIEEGVTAQGLDDLQTRLGQVFPDLDLSKAVETWSGIRPRTRDRVPHVGRLEPGLYLASGHYRSGISMAPRTGSVIADSLDGISLESDAMELSPLRSPGGWRRS